MKNRYVFLLSFIYIFVNASEENKSIVNNTTKDMLHRNKSVINFVNFVNSHPRTKGTLRIKRLEMRSPENRPHPLAGFSYTSVHTGEHMGVLPERSGSSVFLNTQQKSHPTTLNKEDYEVAFLLYNLSKED